MNGKTPPEDIERALQLRSEGLSASQTGALMGRTRSMVLGVLNRADRKADGRGEQRRPRGKVGKPKTQRVAKLSLLADVPPSPPCDAIEIEALTDHTCRWPVTNEGPPFMYCGGLPLPGTPYCVEHWKIAHGVGVYRKDVAA